MTVILAVMIVTALGAILGAVLGGCGSRQAWDDRPGTAGQAWLWESLDRHARLVPGAGLPPSHPLARLGRSPSQSA